MPTKIDVYKYDRINNSIIVKDSMIILLRPVDQEDLFMRRCERLPYFILKDGDEVFTINNIDSLGTFNLSHKNCPHLCLECKRFFDCPKVIEESISKKITKKSKYIASQRIEKYKFIRLGYENLSYFFVWECDEFKK